MAAATKASTKSAKKPAASTETAKKAPRRTAAAVAKSPRIATASIEDESMNGATIATSSSDAPRSSARALAWANSSCSQSFADALQGLMTEKKVRLSRHTSSGTDRSSRTARWGLAKPTPM